DGRVKEHLVRNGSRVVPLPENFPIAVLIDRYTESSAEVLAAALKERGDHTKLIGQTTFGKACSQTFFCLKVDKRKVVGAICVTVEKFISPKTGDSYHGRGIEPDTQADNEVDQLSGARTFVKEEIDRMMPPMRKEMSPF